MKAVIPVIYLIVLLTVTLIAAAQPMSTIDAIQNLKLAQTEDLAVSDSHRIDALYVAVADLRNSIDTSRAWIVGFGSCLTVLHLLQLMKGWKRTNGDSPRLKERY